MKKLTKRLLCAVLSLIAALSLASCANSEGDGKTTDTAAVTSGEGAEAKLEYTEEEMTAMLNTEDYIEMSVKDFGVMRFRLYPDIAPITVSNFVGLAKSGFYDGLTFHRIMQTFMIHGGDPLGTGTGSSSQRIKGEFSENGVENPISHLRGVISMARSTPMNSASCQFFIVTQSSQSNVMSLNGKYAAFGRLVSGFGVLDSLASVQCTTSSTGENSAPVTPPVIEYVKVLGYYDEAMSTKEQNKVTAEIAVESFGKISIELYPDIAPLTVQNFIDYANAGFYDGTVFHRIVSGFMIQGGGFGQDNEKKATNAPIKGEFDENGVENALTHDRGVISMARTSASMDSATSQFFIIHEDSPHLNGQYAAFGRVTDGLDVVDAIAAVECSGETPVTPPVITSVKITSEGN